MVFPRLYAIIDASSFADPRALLSFAENLLAAGVTLLQYRNKQGSARQVLSHARDLKLINNNRALLIMNDRADLCLAAAFNGVHLGQDDLSPDAARRIVPKPLWMGISTHTPGQLRVADRFDADYLAVGPVFPTRSKQNPDPLIGLEGVRAARSLTQRPLVAIGGITRANARSVFDAGADSVAVISDLLLDPRRAAEHFLSLYV